MTSREALLAKKLTGIDIYTTSPVQDELKQSLLDYFMETDEDQSDSDSDTAEHTSLARGAIEETSIAPVSASSSISSSMTMLASADTAPERDFLYCGFHNDGDEGRLAAKLF